MKRIISILLATAMIAVMAISASAAIFTYDPSDDEYWDKDINMLDKDELCIVLWDGTVSDANGISVDSASVEWESNKLSNLPHGWYEAVWCDVGEDCSAADGKIALALRGNLNFQTKANNALAAGAVGLFILNNCRDEEVINDDGEVEGEYQVVNMSEPDNGTLPQWMLSSDVTLKLAAKCLDKAIADLLPTIVAVRDGELTHVGIEPTSTCYIYIGTINEYATAGEPSADNLVDTSAIVPVVVEVIEYTYPNSGLTGNLINGTVIGNETGYGDSAACGAAAAFDGNPTTFFDPLAVGDGFCGMQAAASCTLEKVAILSRIGQEARFAGAMIQGSNDGETWTTLWTSAAAAVTTEEYTVVTEFENNTGYTMYRYYNETNHGDVAEVEFYSVEEVTAAAEAPAETPAEEPVVEEPVVEEPVVVETPVETVTAPEVTTPEVDEAAQTFDMGIIAAVAAVVSLAGYTVSKKK